MDFYRWLENRKFMAKGVSTVSDPESKTRMVGLAVLGKSSKEIANDPVIAARGLPRADCLNRTMARLGITGSVRNEIKKLHRQTHFPPSLRRDPITNFDDDTIRKTGSFVLGQTNQYPDPELTNLDFDDLDKIKQLILQTQPGEIRKSQIAYDIQNNRNTYGFNPKRDSVGVGGSAQKKASIPPPGFVKIKRPMEYGTDWEYNHVPAENIDQYTDDGWTVVAPRKRTGYGNKRRRVVPQTMAPQVAPQVAMPATDPNVVPIKQRPMVSQPAGSFTDDDIQSFFGNRRAN